MNLVIDGRDLRGEVNLSASIST